MNGPSVPAGGNRIMVTTVPAHPFHHLDGFRHNGFRHDHFRNQFGGFVGYPIYYNPYGYYDTETTEQPQPAANNYEQPVDDEGPGLTVFERRRDYQLIGDSQRYQREQQDQRSAEARTEDKSVDKKGEVATTPAAPPEDVVSTILVFRDGSHREIRNYALMGNGIYDLSVKPGQGKMKILLADLDIPATIAANDQRGIDFKLPKQ